MCLVFQYKDSYLYSNDNGVMHNNYFFPHCSTHFSLMVYVAHLVMVRLIVKKATLLFLDDGAVVVSHRHFHYLVVRHNGGDAMVPVGKNVSDGNRNIRIR